MKRLPRRLRYGEEATLVEHLDELRTRLFVSIFAVSIAFAVAFAFHGYILDWLIHPLPPDKRKLFAYGVGEPFLISFKVSFLAGVAAAFPILLWQFWSFFAPALQENLQRKVVAFVTFATGLLAAGVAFGYYVVLPKALHFLTHYEEGRFNLQPRAREYLSFVTAVLLGVGVVFELPVFILSLVRLGILTPARLRKNRRLGYFLVAVVGVLLPGIDPVTTMMETVPLWILFEGSIWLSVFFDKRWKIAEQARLAEEV